MINRGDQINKRISLWLPQALIAQLDGQADQLYGSRAEFIRQAIIDKLQHGQTEANTVNILMSDQQLVQMMQSLQRERQRRNSIRYNHLYRDGENC